MELGRIAAIFHESESNFQILGVIQSADPWHRAKHIHQYTQEILLGAIRSITTPRFMVNLALCRSATRSISTRSPVCALHYIHRLNPAKEFFH